VKDKKSKLYKVSLKVTTTKYFAAVVLDGDTPPSGSAEEEVINEIIANGKDYPERETESVEWEYTEVHDLEDLPIAYKENRPLDCVGHNPYGVTYPPDLITYDYRLKYLSCPKILEILKDPNYNPNPQERPEGLTDDEWDELEGEWCEELDNYEMKTIKEEV